jgi:hypothetical protein
LPTFGYASLLRSLRVQSGRFAFGQNSAPFSDLESFVNGGNGFYQFKLKNVKYKLVIHPDYAPNIYTSLRIMRAVGKLNAIKGT